MKRIVLLIIAFILLMACSATQQVIITPTPIPPTLTPTLTETPSPTETPTLTPTPAFSCPNAPEPQLKVGDMGRVTDEGPGVRLRRDPVVINDNILTVVPAGTTFEVIEGPECAPIPESEAFFVFWKVQIPGNPANTSVGWLAEGDAAGYFIEPISEDEQP